MDIIEIVIVVAVVLMLATYLYTLAHWIKEIRQRCGVPTDNPKMPRCTNKATYKNKYGQFCEYHYRMFFVAEDEE